MSVVIEKFPILYRGDSVPKTVRSQSDPLHRGRTFAELYLSEGLMAKSADGAIGKHLALDTDYLIHTHIGYKQGTSDDPSTEEWISKHSPFISFSTEKDSAMYFVDRTKKKNLESCAFENGEYFLWQLGEIPGVKIKEGLFALAFKTSTCNVKKFLTSGIAAANAGSVEAALSILPTLIVHGHLDNDQSWHQAILVDVVTYLSSNPSGPTVSSDLRDRALTRAKKWSEWLLYPLDLMPDGRGFSARFPPNQYLDLVDCYMTK